MRIGITTFGGDGGKSGISRYIVKLLQEFDRLNHNHEFEVLLFEDEKDVFLQNTKKLSSLTFKRNIKNPLVNLLWHQAFLPGICRKRGYDLLFLPAGNRRLSFYLPCASVGTVHDFSSLHVQDKYDMFRMFYIKRVLPVLMRRLTKVLTVSLSSRKDILEYAKIPPEKVTVTHLAADSLYSPGDKKLSFSLVSKAFKVSAPYILYISRIEHPGKNHARLIKAFEILKQKNSFPLQLLLAGPDKEQAKKVHELAEKSIYKKDIFFTGFVPDKILPDLYRGAEFLVFPSLYEGFGLPLLESMASGTPVACSNLSSLPEVVGEAGLVFDPYDPEKIAYSMEILANNKFKREELAQKGMARAKEFTWTKCALKTLEVFKALENN